MIDGLGFSGVRANGKRSRGLGTWVRLMVDAYEYVISLSLTCCYAWVLRDGVLRGPGMSAGSTIQRAHGGGEGHSMEPAPAWHTCLGGGHGRSVHPLLEQPDVRAP